MKQKIAALFLPAFVATCLFTSQVGIASSLQLPRWAAKAIAVSELSNNAQIALMQIGWNRRGAIEAEICYQIPEKVGFLDYEADGVQLIINGAGIEPDKVSMTKYLDADGNAYDFRNKELTKKAMAARCDLFEFSSVRRQTLKASNYWINVAAIRIPPYPESTTCEDFKRFETEVKPPFTVKCGVSPNTVGYEVVGLPKGLSKRAARAAVDDFILQANNGDWVVMSPRTIR